MSVPSAGPFWKEALAPYAEPRLGRSLLDLRRPVLRVVGRHVLPIAGLPRPGPDLGRTGRRVPRARIRRLPRLLPRLAAALQARQRLGRRIPWAVGAVAV